MARNTSTRLILLVYVALAQLRLATVVASSQVGGSAAKDRLLAGPSSHPQAILSDGQLQGQPIGAGYTMSQTPPAANDPNLENWNTPPGADSSANLIFSSVSGLLHHWHNTRYRNGHTVVPVTISPGTILYHGRERPNPPQSNDWLSFDFEHSYLFCIVDCYMATYVATRPLKILYLDGSSAAKMDGGGFDSQDIIFEGKVIPGSWHLEFSRVARMCEWATELGLDGFMRMEFDFELIHCNFTEGLRLVSNLHLITSNAPLGPAPPFPQPTGTPQLSPPTGPNSAKFTSIPHKREGLPPILPPMLPFPIPNPLPPGWVGSWRSEKSLDFEAIQAGGWHDFAPGVNGVEVDYSRLITFFDPRFQSLVQARRHLTPDKYRLLNMSQADVTLFMNDLRGVLTRKEAGSGVNWGGITRDVIKKHAQRLEYLERILSPSTGGFEANATTIAIRARQHVMMMLAPYMLRSAVPHMPSTPGPIVPSPSERWSNTTWLSDPIRFCSTSFTPVYPSNISPQEEVLRTAIEQTMHEICRTLGVIWVDAFVVEKVDYKEAKMLVNRWKGLVENLMHWLDWSVWVRCKPTCGPVDLCTLPQWPFSGTTWPDGYEDMTPRCIPRE